MSVIETLRALGGTVRAAVDALSDNRRPTEIIVYHPANHPLAGEIAGRHILARTADGAASYKFEATPPAQAVPLLPVPSTLPRDHVFADLGSLERFIATRPGVTTFIDVPEHKDAALRVLLDEEQPQDGGARLTFHRHPEWRHWFRAFAASAVGGGERFRVGFVDLDQETFGDFLLDHAESLGEKFIAMVNQVAVIKSATRVAADVDLAGGTSYGFKIQRDGGEDLARLPRDFEADLPAYLGAWEPGKEPTYKAVFRLRVIWPRNTGGDGRPTFRVTWENLAEFELAAQQDLVETVRGKLGTERPIYLGVANVQRFAPVRPAV